jgi:hypothetical protein
LKSISDGGTGMILVANLIGVSQSLHRRADRKRISSVSAEFKEFADIYSILHQGNVRVTPPGKEKTVEGCHKYAITFWLKAIKPIGSGDAPGIHNRVYMEGMWHPCFAFLESCS